MEGKNFIKQLLTKEPMERLTAEKALERNMKFLKGSVEDVSVEELIAAAKEDKTLKEVKVEKVCPNCGSKNLKVMNILGGKIEICPDCSHRGKL